MSILEVKSVSKSFGGVQANVDISVAVEQGSIVGLIGPNGSGKIISIDLKEMEKIKNTIQIKGDFTEINIQNRIKNNLDEAADVVMSDMAVNTTGIKNVDSIQTGELCKEAMTFSKNILNEKGFFISKIFMGGNFNEIVALGKKIFKEVRVFKPKSSRKDSKESFIICNNIR